MPYTTRKFIIGPNDSGRRADRILRILYKDMPLSMIYRLFRDGAVRVSGKKADGSLRVENGQTIEVRLLDTPKNSASDRRVHDAPGKTFDAARFAGIILIETPDIVVVNKPRGVLTHGEGGIDETAKAYFAERMSQSLSFTPAPLHRLDRNTSGALAVSASLAGAAAFSLALREGRVGKLYIAVLGGELPENQTWIDELSRDDATKTSRVDEAGARAEAQAIPVLVQSGLTLAIIRLGTGRTHQIRAQAAARGYALAGDAKYGGSPLSGGYVLHCAVLDVPPLAPDAHALRSVAPLPADAIKTLRTIFGDDFEARLTVAIKQEGSTRY